MKKSGVVMSDAGVGDVSGVGGKGGGAGGGGERPKLKRSTNNGFTPRKNGGGRTPNRVHVGHAQCNVDVAWVEHSRNDGEAAYLGNIPWIMTEGEPEERNDLLEMLSISGILGFARNRALVPTKPSDRSKEWTLFFRIRDDNDEIDPMSWGRTLARSLTDYIGQRVQGYETYLANPNDPKYADAHWSFKYRSSFQVVGRLEEGPLNQFTTANYASEVLLSLYYEGQDDPNIYDILDQVGDQFYGPKLDSQGNYVPIFVNDANYVIKMVNHAKWDPATDTLEELANHLSSQEG